ncbi:MAG TPA: hypothetical protein VF407_00715 [Polyangiaceae bacterium]
MDDKAQRPVSYVLRTVIVFGVWALGTTTASYVPDATPTPSAAEVLAPMPVEEQEEHTGSRPPTAPPLLDPPAPQPG